MRCHFLHQMQPDPSDSSFLKTARDTILSEVSKGIMYVSGIGQFDEKCRMAINKGHAAGEGNLQFPVIFGVLADVCQKLLGNKLCLKGKFPVLFWKCLADIFPENQNLFHGGWYLYRDHGSMP